MLHSLSPSLLAAGQGPDAYELKFLLSEEQAHAAEALARTQLALDPHADPARGGAYRTTSLYCDTAAFDVYRRIGPGRQRKHRLRRYDAAPFIYLERKTRRGDRVRKRRTRIAEAELPRLAASASAPTEWPGAWFERQLARRQLRPVSLIAYDRLALVGHQAEGPLRLTFDRCIAGALTTDWRLAPLEDGLPLFAGQVICEMKYRGALPALFKEIVQALRLAPQPVSKYRALMRATGAADHGA